MSMIQSFRLLASIFSSFSFLRICYYYSQSFSSRSFFSQGPVFFFSRGPFIFLLAGSWKLSVYFIRQKSSLSKSITRMSLILFSLTNCSPYEVGIQVIFLISSMALILSSWMASIQVSLLISSRCCMYLMSFQQPASLSRLMSAGVRSACSSKRSFVFQSLCCSRTYFSLLSFQIAFFAFQIYSFDSYSCESSFSSQLFLAIHFIYSLSNLSSADSKNTQDLCINSFVSKFSKSFKIYSFSSDSVVLFFGNFCRLLFIYCSSSILQRSLCSLSGNQKSKSFCRRAIRTLGSQINIRFKDWFQHCEKST